MDVASFERRRISAQQTFSNEKFLRAAAAEVEMEALKLNHINSGEPEATAAAAALKKNKKRRKSLCALVK